MADTLRALWLLWCADYVSQSMQAHFDIVGRAVSSKSLMARCHPAQDGEDEAGEGYQCSQATVNDCEIAGVTVDSDWDCFEVGGCRLHGCVVLKASRVTKEEGQLQEVKVFAYGLIML